MRLRGVYVRARGNASSRSMLPLARIRADDGWCDEPADRNYNRPVRLPYSASAETMLRNDELYDVVIVLDWNIRRRARGRGSAVFRFGRPPVRRIRAPGQAHDMKGVAPLRGIPFGGADTPSPSIGTAGPHCPPESRRNPESACPGRVMRGIRAWRAALAQHRCDSRREGCGRYGARCAGRYDFIATILTQSAAPAFRGATLEDTVKDAEVASLHDLGRNHITLHATDKKVPDRTCLKTGLTAVWRHRRFLRSGLRARWPVGRTEN